MHPCRLSFPLGHFHVTENRNEPWLLTDLLVEMDIGSLMEHAVQDIVARGRVGFINVRGTWVRAERVPEAERRNWTQERTTLEGKQGKKGRGFREVGAPPAEK